MRVIKPFRLSILQRVLTVRRTHHLGIGALVLFPFDAPEVALPEITMWQKVAPALGKDAILDEGMPKPRGEVLAFGSAFAPGKQARPAFSARIQVASIDKTLYVVGRRRWKSGVPTDPEPITDVAITWQNAFGGPGYAPNPVGMGLSPVEEDGVKVHPLPHLEDPRHLLMSPRDRPPPACFGALDPTWQERIAKTGTYDAAWLERDFPGFARDLDPEYFQVAPADQRLPSSYFQGGEPITLENLHPDRPRIETRVPRLRVRCFVSRKGPEGDGPLEEVSTRLETLILFPNLERGVALFRGVADVVEDDATDLSVLLAAIERPDAPRPIDHYRDALARRLDKAKGYLHAIRERDLMPDPDPDAPSFPDEKVSDMEELTRREGRLEARSRARLGRELDRARLEMRAAGLDPDEKLPKELPPAEEPPKLDELADFVEQAEKEADRLKKDGETQRKGAEEAARKTCAELGLDYEALVEKGRREGGGPPKFRADAELARLRGLAESGRALGVPLEDLEARIEDPAFVGTLRKLERDLLSTYRSFAHYFEPAQPPGAEAKAALRAEVERALAAGESLARRDLTCADLSGMSLAKADLREALLEGADLAGCDLQGADLSGAVLARATLAGARLRGANLAGANLGEAHAGGVSFEGADLKKAVLHRSRLDGARFGGADLRGADLFEAIVAGADLSGADASEVAFFRLDLGDARFAEAKLGKTIFFQCKGGKLDFAGAHLEGAGFLELKADQPIFRGAKASNLRILSTPECASELPGADFSGAELATSNFRGVNLAGATFEGATCDGSDFSEAVLRGARLATMRARGAMFMRADLTDADLTDADLMEALLQRSRLGGARFERANLFRANLTQARGDDRTSFAGANVKRTLFTKEGA
ncbi:MAG: DUF2169 domain-containing protein [Polyangiaceae bacterium]|nr:DUF2169 domain-containing protein [Polyangiaceae bacterium]